MSLVEHAGHVRQQQQRLDLQRRGDGAGRGVGVDIVGLAVAPMPIGAITGMMSDFFEIRLRGSAG